MGLGSSAEDTPGLANAARTGGETYEADAGSAAADDVRVDEKEAREMKPLRVGQRICTYRDGSPRFGEIIGIQTSGNVVCNFEDEADPIDYWLRQSEVYVVAPRRELGREGVVEPA